MNTLLSNIGTIISSLISWMGNVASELISNNIFQIMLGVILFIIFVELMFDLAGYISIRRDIKKGINSRMI